MTACIWRTHCSRCSNSVRSGRRYACKHCGAQKQVAFDSDQLAEGLKLDLDNVEGFLAGLAKSLLHAFPDRTRILHEGAAIVLLELNIDPHLYLVKREMQGGYVGQYKKLVRGVALKTKNLPLDQWVTALTQAIADHANQNARVASVLAQLRGQ